ncbi:MAG: DUF4366 domain-containing protein [Oscillospiraceae bacterium]|nr:DUF4366 domain-containing protein [Oscillospiraceae bacterium]
MKTKILIKLFAVTLFFSMLSSVIFAETLEDDSGDEITIETVTPETELEESPDDTPSFTDVPPDVMGNMQLVERQEILFTDGTFEFISVTTRAGNVFYVFIRHDFPEDTANVFFLNKVSERDLLSLLYSPEEIDGFGYGEYGNRPNIARPQSPSGDSESAESDKSNDDETLNDSTSNDFPVPLGNIVIVGAVVLLGIGALVFFSFRGKKKNKIAEEDYDDDYGQDDDYADDE